VRLERDLGKGGLFGPGGDDLVCGMAATLQPLERLAVTGGALEPDSAEFNLALL